MPNVEVNFVGLSAFEKKVAGAVNAGLTAAAISHEGFIIRGFGTQGRYQSSPVGSPPNVRRGGLRNSITHVPSTAFRASSGSTSRYALTHEQGKIIKPRRGKYIPVPLNIPAMREQEKFGARGRPHPKPSRASTGLRGSSLPARSTVAYAVWTCTLNGPRAGLYSSSASGPRR